MSAGQGLAGPDLHQLGEREMNRQTFKEYAAQESEKILKADVLQLEWASLQGGQDG